MISRSGSDGGPHVLSGGFLCDHLWMTGLTSLLDINKTSPTCAVANMLLIRRIIISRR
jgi:hypothetical protein